MKRTEGRTGLYAHWLGSSRSALLATFAEAPANFVWSPDGRSLAFTKAAKAEADELVPARSGPEGSEWARPPRVIYRERYRTNAAGFLELAYDHVFVIPAEAGTARQLAHGDFDHGGKLSFTPDGGQILFSANRNEGWELAVREADNPQARMRVGSAGCEYAIETIRNLRRQVRPCLA